MKVKQILFLLSCLIFLALSTSACADDNKTTPTTSAQKTADNSDEPITAEDVQRFGLALEIIKRYYVEDVPNKKLFDNALRGLVDGLDPHSEYLDESELSDLKEATSGQFSGLGVEVMPDNGYLKVVTPIDDSPAQKAGMKPGDYIIKINNELVRDMTLGEAIKKMRGPNGSSVDLTIVRTGAPKPLVLKVIRGVVKLESVKSKLLQPGFGYLRISNFQENTATDLEKAVSQLKQTNGGNFKGVILDLRNNPGGLLDPAVQVADDLLSPKDIKSDENLIVSAKGRFPGADFAIKAKPANILSDAPIVVLINQGSASGAEIVAGALQDYRRAVLVGENSFGKGSVQTVIPLDDKTAIKLTTALYYTPNGRSIQASGIHPDVVVDDIQIPSKDESDEDDSKIYIKESDLKGHLANNKPTTESALQAVPADTSLLGKDYQLSVALNILKALAAVQHSKQ